MHTPALREERTLALIADRLLPHLVRKSDEPIPTMRIWLIGCQTEEEPLLLLLSLLQGLKVPTSRSPFTIFVTDPDAEAITRARRLASSSHLERWSAFPALQPLLKNGREGVSLPEAWRKSLIFATHDLLTDAPFSHLDLIIAQLPFSTPPEVQQTALLGYLAYTLVPQGLLLLLGKQEAATPDVAFFQQHEAGPISFYQRTATPMKYVPLRLADRRYQPPAEALEVHPGEERAPIEELQTMLEKRKGHHREPGEEHVMIEELQTMLEEQEVRYRELEAQSSANHESRLAQLHLAAIVASSEDAILSKDLDGIITSWNEGAERLYGYSAQEMVGQSVGRIFPPGRQEEFTSIMNQIRRGERVAAFDTMRLHKDGRLVPVAVTISPVRESDGTIIGASTIAHDITPRRALEQQREAFVDLVTHELKTPLTALSGNIQLAHRWLTRLLAHPDRLDEEQQRALEEVLIMLGRSQQQMRTQKRLIDDLLDLSHVQQGTLELHQESCNLLSLLYETVQDHQAAYPSRLIELDLPEQDEVVIYGDRDRLGQVLSNYLSNALKFAPAERPVRVGMHLQEGKVRVWVQDEGPGLSPEQQAHIWERYFQVSQASVQKGWKVGLGLGLYICHQLIRQQQGEVGIESTSGQGATFWFSLPFHAPQE